MLYPTFRTFVALLTLPRQINWNCMLLVGRKHDNEKNRTNFCNTVTFQLLGKNEDIFFLLLALADKCTGNYFSKSKKFS